MTKKYRPPACEATADSTDSGTQASEEQPPQGAQKPFADLIARAAERNELLAQQGISAFERLMEHLESPLDQFRTSQDGMRFITMHVKNLATLAHCDHKLHPPTGGESNEQL